MCASRRSPPVVCLRREHKLVLDEKPTVKCKNGDILALESCGSFFAVWLWIQEVFSSAGLNVNRDKRMVIEKHPSCST